MSYNRDSDEALSKKLDVYKPLESSASRLSNLLTGDQWKKSRADFECLAINHGWDLSEHPLHAIYLDGDTQRFWEVFKAGAVSAS